MYVRLPGPALEQVRGALVPLGASEVDGSPQVRHHSFYDRVISSFQNIFDFDEQPGRVACARFVCAGETVVRHVGSRTTCR